jgi:hypothetical protein
MRDEGKVGEIAAFVTEKGRTDVGRAERAAERIPSKFSPSIVRAFAVREPVQAFCRFKVLSESGHLQHRHPQRTGGTSVMINRGSSRGTSMVSKASFTPEEWDQVLGGVMMAGFAVSAADPSGLWGLLKETFASGRGLMEAKSSAGASDLSRAIVTDMETSEGRTAVQHYVKARLKGATREDLKKRAIEALRVAAVVIDAKAPTDATGYKSWLLHIANNVAKASNEGGFLGFGGVAVSEAEKATLADIATALGVPPQA